MKFGVCINLAEELEKKTLNEHLEQIRSAGYDYVEANLAALENTSEEELAQIQAALEKTGLSCLRANCFFPGTVRLTGPESSPEALAPYLKKILAKAEKLGVQVIVLGSGGARRVPEGYDRKAAEEDFAACARAASDAAASHHIRIALEHLNPKETNLLTTIEETVQSMQQIQHPACGFLFDYYHVDLQTDDIRQVPAHSDRLFHVHTALPSSRLFPFPEDASTMQPFFQVLKEAGYNGTVSLEGAMREGVSYQENLEKSMELLKKGLA